MTPRIHVDQPLEPGQTLVLPPAASRHVQVLRLQPGAALTLFNGHAGEWSASVLRMGRSEVEVRVDGFCDVDREPQRQVTLAIGMPANERMDNLIEKATELGVTAVQPLLCERSVLRLAGERAQKKVEHWQAVAIAASEQSGRTHVPHIEPVRPLSAWLAALLPDGGERYVLSLRASIPFAAPTMPARCLVLSGPEGGLSVAEESAALQAGFRALSLGPRVLRADTAPLAVLAALILLDQR